VEVSNKSSTCADVALTIISRKSSSASWEAKISISSDSSGLRIHASENVRPVFTNNRVEGVTTQIDEDAHKLLSDHLPSTIDFKDIASDLQEMLQGMWKYGYAGLREYPLRSPVFTRNGDLIIQMLSQDTGAARAGAGAAAQAMQGGGVEGLRVQLGDATLRPNSREYP
jgi:hypothetical protein